MGLLDNVELVNLNWDLYQKWRSQINKTNLCDRYKTDIQKFIKQVINFAEKQWDFNLRKFYNKLEPFKTPGALKKEMDFYEPEEFFKFISVVDDLRYKCFFELLYYCGLRRGELRGLTWDNINLIRKTLTVNKQVVSVGLKGCKEMLSSPKTQKSNRTIPLPDVLVEDLKAYKETCKTFARFNEKFYVFGDVKPIPPDKIRHEKSRVAHNAGLREIRLHDFRHSCASLLINNGANVNAVAHYLGHTKIEETLNTYTHLYESTLTTVTNLINQLPNKKD